MKKNVSKDIAEMKTFVKKMPKSINEILSFEDSGEEMGEYEDEAMPEEAPLASLEFEE